MESRVRENDFPPAARRRVIVEYGLDIASYRIEHLASLLQDRLRKDFEK
jgi:hypothetical protein